MVIGLTVGSWPAWIAALGVAMVVIRGIGMGAPTVFGFQRSTIEGLQEKIRLLEKGAEDRDKRIAELEAVIANTRDLTPILTACHEASDEHKQLIETMTANTTALQGLSMLIHAKGDSNVK